MSIYGPPGNEELYHWKYVRKYKKNGKWRYVYPNDKFGIKEKISTKITGSAYDQHIEELQELKRRQDNAAFQSTQNSIHYGAIKNSLNDENAKKEKESEANARYHKAASKQIQSIINDVAVERYRNYVSNSPKHNAKAIIQKGKDAIKNFNSEPLFGHTRTIEVYDDGKSGYTTVIKDGKKTRKKK